MKTEDKTKQKAVSRQERLRELDHACVPRAVTAWHPSGPLLSSAAGIWSWDRSEPSPGPSSLLLAHTPPVLPINANVHINANFMPKKKL